MMFPAVPYSRYVAGLIPWYSVLIVTGITVAFFLSEREQKRLGLPQDTVLDLAFWVLPCGIIGARLYYVAFSWELFARNPLSILKIWEGGLAIYGGIIGGGLAVSMFSIKHKLSPLTLLDMIVPGLALAQAIGRWGNYFNMEAYGRPVSDPMWQFFPAAVLIPQNGTYVWHMATFFYESMWNVSVFLMLWFVIRKRSTRPGSVFLWYLVLYGVGRTLIEGLRMDSLMTGTLRVSQVLSMTLAISAAMILLFRRHRAKTTNKEVG